MRIHTKAEIRLPRPVLQVVPRLESRARESLEKGLRVLPVPTAVLHAGRLLRVGRQEPLHEATRPFGVDASLNLYFEVRLNNFFCWRHLRLSLCSIDCGVNSQEKAGPLHLTLHSLEAVG